MYEFPFERYLSDSESQSLRAGLVLKKYGDKELVFSRREDCVGAFYVVSGVIRVYLTDNKGNAATVFRLRQGEYCAFSAHCVFPDVKFEPEIETEGNTELLLIPGDVFSMLAAQNVYVENFAYKVMAGKISNLLTAMQQLMFCSLEERVIGFLGNEMTAENSLMLRITQQQIAEEIGSAREAVSRILGKLSERGLIATGRGKINILKPNDLVRQIKDNNA